MIIRFKTVGEKVLTGIVRKEFVAGGYTYYLTEEVNPVGSDLTASGEIHSVLPQNVVEILSEFSFVVPGKIQQAEQQEEDPIQSFINKAKKSLNVINGVVAFAATVLESIEVQTTAKKEEGKETEETATDKKE